MPSESFAGSSVSLQSDAEHRRDLRDVMVDTGSEYNWIPPSLLVEFGVAPEMVERAFDHRRAFVRRADISMRCDRGASGREDTANRFIHLFVVDVRYDHVRTLARKPKRHGSADSRARPRDDRHSIAKFTHALRKHYTS